MTWHYSESDHVELGTRVAFRMVTAWYGQTHRERERERTLETDNGLNGDQEVEQCLMAR